MTYYYIVFPRGDKTKLSIIDLSYHTKYEINDYSLASRKEFCNLNEVINYAKDLAKKHNLELSSLNKDIQQEIDFLD